MNKLIRKILILSFLSTNYLSSSLLSQTLTNKEFIRAVKDADMYYYFNEDFEKAASLYEVLLQKYPENSNISAKLGICYLNIDGKKAEALGFLKKASGNIVKSDDEYLEFGQKAPIDTWFYFAHAYLVNDSLQKAISLYLDLKKKIGSTEAFRIEYIDKQIQACRYAAEMEKNPVAISIELLFPWLKDYPGAANPVISENDSVFIFSRKFSEKNHIYCSYKTATWQKPIDITSQIGVYDNLVPNSITARGDMLIVYMDDGADGNLYISNRKGAEWTKMRKLNKNINTKYWEAHGFISPDGKQLFFSSNRPEGYGELDIWVSKTNEEGDWDPAENLGNIINSEYNENTPFYVPSKGALLFSSLGHNGMGGYDIFSSTLKNGIWTKPVGMPYPINTTSDNTTFIEDSDGKGYITSLVQDQNRIRNIYRIQMLGISSETIVVKGSISLQDGINIVPGLAEIVYNRADSTWSWKKAELSDSGTYKFETKPGDYIIRINYKGYKKETLNLNIPATFTGKFLTVSTSLIPGKVSSGEFLAIRNILFGFNSYSLSDEGRLDLEKLKTILNNYPELKIEVSGYTDIIGSASYNKKLADKRAQTAIDYLVSSGIQGSRFIKKAIGAEDFIAINVNLDGTDNPEGRQYNRRVAIGIINPQTGITIRQESYTPPGLRQPYTMRYVIVLMKSREKFYPDYFRDFQMNELFFVRPVFKDSLYLYVLGDFTNRRDAESYLGFAREKGFKEGYILNKYDLQEQPRQIMNQSENNGRKGEARIYTIQLKAARKQMNIDEFKPLVKVEEYKGKDGYFRYAFGEFENFSAAKEALMNLRKSGNKDAFIKEYNLLINQ